MGRLPMTTLIMMRRKVCLGDWADTGPVHYTQSATSLSKQTSDNNLCPTSSVFTEGGGGGKTYSSELRLDMSTLILNPSNRDYRGCDNLLWVAALLLLDVCPHLYWQITRGRVNTPRGWINNWPANKTPDAALPRPWALLRLHHNIGENTSSAEFLLNVTAIPLLLQMIKAVVCFSW